MEGINVTQLMDDVRKDWGYQRKGRLFWRMGDEVTMLCELENDPWGPGVYVNYGATPSRMITKVVPPHYEYWGIQGRSEGLKSSPYKDVFTALACGQRGLPSEAKIRDAFTWLLGWIEDHFGDAETLRRAVLNMPKGSIVLRGGRVFVLMRDWANGELKDPSSYFKNAPYYKTSEPLAGEA